MNLSSHHFILTGASGGLGSALARSLTKVGCRLTLIGRDRGRLHSLGRELDQAYLQLDINTEDAQLALVEYVVAQQQKIPVTGLINNAGVAGFGMLVDLKPQQLDAVITTNLLTPMHLTQRLLPEIQKVGKGLIVNIGSTFGDIGYPANTSYCASKFGLRGFTEALRRELCDTSIKVMYIAPRAISTAMNDQRVQKINQVLGVSEDEPQVVAEAIVESLRQEHSNTYIGWQEKWIVKINRLLPSVVDHSLRQHLTVIKQEINYDQSMS